MEKMTPSNFLICILIPGTYQIYAGEKVKGALMFVLYLISMIGFFFLMPFLVSAFAIVFIMIVLLLWVYNFVEVLAKF